MICKKCHNNVKTDFKYCPYCGERVISDFQESYGELTPPFIIEDREQENEAARLFAPNPIEKQPDFDLFSSAPPKVPSGEKPLVSASETYERPPRDDRAPLGGYAKRSAGYTAQPKREASYFVYPEELMYGSGEDAREDGYAHDAPKAAEPRYNAPKAAEPRYDAPKAAEPRYDAPKAAEPRYDAPSEKYYVHPMASRPGADRREESYSKPSVRMGEERHQAAGSTLNVDAPDQCIQIDMSFAEPDISTVNRTDRVRTDTGAAAAPYYVYGHGGVPTDGGERESVLPLDGERESVLPFDSEFSSDPVVRVRQSGAEIAAKLVLILLITAVAIPVAIFGYRYITGLSNKPILQVGNASSAISSIPESPSSTPEASSALEPSPSTPEASSTLEPSSSIPEESSAPSSSRGASDLQAK